MTNWRTPALAAFLLLASSPSALLTSAFTGQQLPFFVPAPCRFSFHHATSIAQVPDLDQITTTTTPESLTAADISRLNFRALQRALAARSLSTLGTVGQLRDRLRQANGLDAECVVNEDGMDDDCVDDDNQSIVQFVDESDPVRELETDIASKAAQGHWKAATRKLKKLSRRYPQHDISPDLYLQVLNVCVADRLHGARAAEPARKIMEQLVENGYGIPETTGNYCIKNCLGEHGTNSSHQGHGGLDTALAMLAALEQARTPVQLDTYDKIIQALAREGSLDHGLELLRHVVVDQAETPPLLTFAYLAGVCVRDSDHHTPNDDEKILSVLAIAKAAGYELDTIASSPDGRTILASAVIAAERMNNIGLGLRLLTAASQAAGVAPDRGDTMVALYSSAAQRACTLLHKTAIIQAVEDGQWQLAVKVLQLMIQRSLKPSPWLWRNVVTCCAKALKSRKATALLLDWVQLSKRGDADKPPLAVFNTVVNACEECDENELTIKVLETMKETHDVEGNLITFNIALKRLAKEGDYFGCEGIIVGMLQGKVEPSVVSYTTSIAACVSHESKHPKIAYEWLKRMRTRNVRPNVVTYNTAFAACLDGTLDSTKLGVQIAEEMLDDVNKQLADDDLEEDEYTNVVPDLTTKLMARRLMEQLKRCWEKGDIAKQEAVDTIRPTLLKLVDFQKSEAAELARLQMAKMMRDDDQADATRRDEIRLEYSAAAGAHRTAEV